MTFPRFYPILDAQALAARDCSLETAATAVIEAGARILQLRRKAAWPRASLAEAERIAVSCRAAGVQLIINDRADIAALLQAGLHLGQDDLAPAAARRVIGGETMLGYSTHNAGQLVAAEAEPATYLALGPIFATATKENPDPVVGLDEFARLRRLTKRPLVAIGGITRQNALAVLDAGADSVAVIGDLLPESLTEASLRQRIEEWLRLVG